MAPTPKTHTKRPSIRTAATDPEIPQGYMMKDGQRVRTGRRVTSTVYRSRAQPQPHDKRNKRQLDRQRLMERVRDAGISKPSQSKDGIRGKKRRRPGKKLVAAEEMGGMRDALPKLEDGGEWEGFSDADESVQAAGKRRRKRAKDAEGKIRMRSLQHRPGAMKRKRRMEGVEMERFGRNLAQLSANTEAVRGQAGEGSAGDVEGGGGGASRKEKWAALRAFIGSTMERKGGFEKA